MKTNQDTWKTIKLPWKTMKTNQEPWKTVKLPCKTMKTNHYALLREGSRYQIRWIFGKIPNGLWPTETHSTSKDLELPKSYFQLIKLLVLLRITCALSKQPHLHRVYFVNCPYSFSITLYVFKAIAPALVLDLNSWSLGKQEKKLKSWTYRKNVCPPN